MDNGVEFERFCGAHMVNAWASEAGIAATRPAVCCSRSASAVGTGDSVAKQLGLF